MDNNVFVPQQTPPANNGTGFSIAALVLGIVGIIGAWIPIVCYFTGICAILGLVFGVIGRKKTKAATGRASGLATAGFVLGIIGVSFAVLGLICILACAGFIASLATV